MHKKRRFFSLEKAMRNLSLVNNKYALMHAYLKELQKGILIGSINS